MNSLRLKLAGYESTVNRPNSRVSNCVGEVWIQPTALTEAV